MRLTLRSIATVALLTFAAPFLPTIVSSPPAFAQTVDDRKAEADRLLQQGNQQFYISEFQAALQSWRLALEIYQAIGDRQGEVSSLSSLGVVSNSLGQYQQAIEFQQQTLALVRVLGDREGEAITLGNLGGVYGSIGQYQQAIEFHEESLAIANELGDRQVQANALNNLGLANENLGHYRQAIEFYEQSLIIKCELGDRRGEANSLGNLGLAYEGLGEYQLAIEFHEQSLTIARELGNREGESASLGNLGIVYQRLGQYQRAIEFHVQQLATARAIGYRRGEAKALGSLGNAYSALGQYQQAIEFFEQQLAIVRDVGYRPGEANALNNLGIAYSRLGQYQQGIEFQQQSLVIKRELGDRQGEANSLGNLGRDYYNLGQYQQAIDSYQQSLIITQAIGDRAGEGLTLSNIGELLAQQDQPELAIVFYKQSVNIRESIRGEIRGLDQELQQSYTDTIADDYRRLADLLLQQDRVLEAQRILDLLKVQELDDYLQDVQRSGRTETGIELAAPEAQIRDRQQAITNRAIAIGQELAQLRQLEPEQRSAQQTARIAELVELQSGVVAEFNNFIDSDEVQALVAQLSRDTRRQDLVAELDELTNLQDSLAKLEQNAVLIYPLILEDRLELVLVTPNSPPTRYPVNVDRTQLNAAIVAFRSALQDPSSNPQPIAQQLYEWLIAPMAADLAAIDAQTILYAPDGVLRYIPLAALHDGNQWLAENFRVNNITAASLNNLNLEPAQQPRILAAAFEQGSFSFQVGERSFAFDGLPFAGTEVENLAATFPRTREYIDMAFTPDAIVPFMDDYTIVHLATHAAFVSGSPNDSFILFGNGDRITLEDIKSWEGRLRQVDLVVLSACETGVGNSLGNREESLGNGEEILGFGYLMQQAGARAAIASLWSVSDGGTQVLMNAFYTALENGKSKAEALQLAQQALITGDFSAIGEPRGDGTVMARDIRTGLSPNVSSNLDHPYYWAPFILIGNGL